MDVRLVTDEGAFLALRERWNRLHRESAPGDPFLSHEWLDAAWQWSRQRGDLHVLCCESEGSLVGAAALLRSHPEAGGVRTLEFLSVPDTQRCDIVARPEHRERVAGAIVDALRTRQREWDVLKLRYLTEGTLTTTRFVPALSQAGYRCEASSVANPWIDLTGSWDSYLASRSRRVKKAINLAANRLKRAGAVEIVWLEPGKGSADEAARALDAATSISARSWKTRTGNSLDNAGPGAFLRTLARHAHRRGWLSIWTLSLDGQAIAMEIQLIVQGNVFALRSDFDAAHDDISPGSHLNRCMLETLFARGLARYSMGPGDNPYKYRWAQGADPVHAVTAYGRSLRGQGRATLDLVVKPAARWVRDRLRGPSAHNDAHDPALAESPKRGRS